MDDEDIIPTHEYELVSIFPSQFSGYCTLDDRHKVKKGDRVGKLRRADNPMVSVPGVSCKFCTLDFPMAKK